MQFEQGSNPPRVKAANQAAILKAIYHCGPIKRSEIAQRLGLTLPTITTTVNSMMARGIIRETSSSQQDDQLMGRKAHPVDIVPDSRHFIGIELQGTRRTACLLDYRGGTLAAAEDIGDCQDYRRNIELSCALMRKVLDACGLRLEQITGIGVCTPGLVDTERGVLEVRPSYNWVHKDIRGDVAAQSGYEGPIWVENNACARAYGAQLFQREVLGDAQTFAYLFIDQGIACPLVLNTATLFGSVVGAGEVGHMVMVPGGLQCSCGNHGCLEAYSSDRALLDRCAALLRKGGAPLLRAQCGAGAPTMEQVLRAQEQGDRDVGEIVERALHILGIGVANINNFACPSKMLIEGKLFCRQENRGRMLAVVRENLCGVIRAGTEFIFVEPKLCSGALGAAAMAICKDLETYVEG